MINGLILKLTKTVNNSQSQDDASSTPLTRPGPSSQSQGSNSGSSTTTRRRLRAKPSPRRPTKAARKSAPATGGIERPHGYNSDNESDDDEEVDAPHASQTSPRRGISPGRGGSQRSQSQRRSERQAHAHEQFLDILPRDYIDQNRIGDNANNLSNLHKTLTGK
jgi:hypothetical protein